MLNEGTTKSPELDQKTFRVGLKIIPKLDSSISLFLLDSASEILFLGDAGDTAASRPSRRYGIEWTNHYRPLSWLSFEADIAATHARFRGDYPDLQYIEQSLRPDHLYLPFPAEIRFAVRDVLPLSRNTNRARCCLPNRSDGPSAASGRAAGDTPDSRGAVLTPSRDD